MLGGGSSAGPKDGNTWAKTPSDKTGRVGDMGSTILEQGSLISSSSILFCLSFHLVHSCLYLHKPVCYTGDAACLSPAHTILSSVSSLNRMGLCTCSLFQLTKEYVQVRYGENSEQTDKPRKLLFKQDNQSNQSSRVKLGKGGREGIP